MTNLFNSPSILSNTSPEKLQQYVSKLLSQRSNFYAQVIVADLKSLEHLQSQKTIFKIPNNYVNSNGNSKNSGIQEKNGNSLNSNSHLERHNDNNNDLKTNIKPVQIELSSSTSTPTPTPSQSISEILLRIVAERTGFPLNSLSLDLSLLDDLNLDSIKTGELVAEIATKLGIEGEVDPSNFANATLGEIAEFLEEYLKTNQNDQNINSLNTNSQIANIEKSSSQINTSFSPPISEILLKIVSESTSFPLDSLSLELRLLDDLNLDSIKTGEIVAELSTKLGIAGEIDPSNFANATLAEIVKIIEEYLQANQNQSQSPSPSSEQVNLPKTTPSKSNSKTKNSYPIWVRDFVMEYTHDEAVAIPDDIEENLETANLFEQDDWNQAKVLIVVELENSNKLWFEALKKALEKKGATVERVTYEELEELSLIQDSQYTHYIGILPHTIKGEMSAEARIKRAIKRVRAIATPLSATKINRNYITVAYLQFGGGHFGRLAQTPDFEQCGTIGFAASLHLERSDLKVRIIDLSLKANPNQLSENIVEELSRREAYLAVGYDENLTRRIPRPKVQNRSLYSPRNIKWSNEDVFLITGGGKGITAECAIALAKKTGVATALVGSSPSPEDAPTNNSSKEIAQTLSRFQEAGLTCRYYQCNVTNSTAIKDLVNQVEKDLGTITGVIHGAALNKPRRVENSTIEEAYAEVGPKMLGVLNLMKALDNKPPKLFVGFSSISSVLGLPGNTWYGFSNEALNIILRRFGEKHPETCSVAVAFSVWSDVGMGAKMGTVRNLNRMGVESMPTEEAVNHFMKLIEQDAGSSEVVVTAKLGGLKTMQRGFDTWRSNRYAPPAHFKFIDEIETLELGVEIIARTRLTLERDSYVKDHIYRGSYLFPTVFGLEAMAQAAAYATEKESLSNIQLEDIKLERPIVVDPDKGVEIEIWAQVLERNSREEPLKVRTEIRTERTGFTMAHFAATFVFTNSQTTPITKSFDIPNQPLNINPKEDLYSWLLFQGPRFQRLQSVYGLNSQEFIYRTEIRHIEGDVKAKDRAEGPFILGDPYYRDSLLQSVQPTIPQDICLPIGIESINIAQINPPVNGSCLGKAVIEAKKGQQYHATVTAINEQGQVIEKLEGYHLQILENKADNPTAEEIANPNQQDQEILAGELNRRAKSLNTVAPIAGVTNGNGLHNLSKEERHQKELPFLTETVGKLMNSNR